MPKSILQINFKFSVGSKDYEQMASSLAGEFAKVPGLIWKIWILNEAENEAGGIYLFDGESSLKSFLEGPLAAQVVSHPAISGLTAKPFMVMDEATATCRGPVD